MYPETRAMDDPYDIHSRGISGHSAVIAEVALSRKSIGTLIIPEWHVPSPALVKRPLWVQGQQLERV